MSEPDLTDARLELQRLAAAAREHGRRRTEAICELALAKLEELEAAVLVARTKEQRGGLARAAKMSPARRQEIARAAARIRWDANKQAPS